MMVPSELSAGCTQPIFRYRALAPEKREIRLIRLETFDFQGPNTEPDAQATVYCSLHYACLEDGPRYTALSYTWGDPSIKRAIYLDGQRVWVTKNLELALRHLLAEYQSLGSTTRLLWVDAICIDQQNENERSQQVSQMGEIFRTAEETAIWLGSASADSALAIETMSSLSAISNAMGGCVRSWSYFPFDDAPNKPEVRAILSELDNLLAELRHNDSEKLVAIISLYERLWFRRVWVIQERVLSRKCIVYCGRDHISWHNFHATFWLLCGLRDYLNLASTDHRDSSVLAASLTAALSRVVPVVFTSAHLSLLQLLSLSSSMAPQAGLQASDPRDYIYSLLGLVQTNSSPEIRVDYSKTWGTVRTEIGEACLAFYGPYILSFAGHCFKAESLDLVVQEAPSWAPDWSSKYLPQPLYVPSVFVIRGPRGNHNCPYSAAKRSTQSLSRSFTANGRLDLSALYVDNIANLGPLFSEDGDPADDKARVASLSSWLHDLDTMLPCVNDVYKTAQEVQDALWRTPIVDRAYVYNWETARASEKTYASYQAAKASNVTGGVKYANIAYNKLFRRRPFRSSTGYIGLGPLGMCEGDTIWIVPGADVPFVFRPAANGTFTIIGEAYVHGIMDGELSESLMGPQNIIII